MSKTDNQTWREVLGEHASASINCHFNASYCFSPIAYMTLSVQQNKKSSVTHWPHFSLYFAFLRLEGNDIGHWSSAKQGF